jgi:hypothetical protein
MTSPAALRATPSRGHHERPGKAGSAVMAGQVPFFPEGWCERSVLSLSKGGSSAPPVAMFRSGRS